VRKLHIEELHGLHSLPNIIWVTKSRRMRYVRHVGIMGNLKKREHSKDPGLNGRIILKRILKK